MGAVGTAPAEGGHGEPMPLVGDDAHAKAPALPCGHDLKGHPRRAHLADQFLGDKLCAIGESAEIDQHLGEFHVIGQGGAETRAAREPRQREVLKDTAGLGRAVLADTMAILLSAAMHDNEAAPLLLGGDEGGVHHAQRLKDLLGDEGVVVHARGDLHKAGADVEGGGGTVHLRLGGLEVQLHGGEVVYDMLQILHILGRAQPLAVAQISRVEAVLVGEQHTGGQHPLGGLLGHHLVLLQLTHPHIRKRGEQVGDGLIQPQLAAADLDEGGDGGDGLGHGGQTENGAVSVLGGQGDILPVAPLAVVGLIDLFAVLHNAQTCAADAAVGHILGSALLQQLGKLGLIQVSHGDLLSISQKSLHGYRLIVPQKPLVVNGISAIRAKTHRKKRNGLPRESVSVVLRFVNQRGFCSLRRMFAICLSKRLLLD